MCVCVCVCVCVCSCVLHEKDASPTYLNILSSNQYAPEPTKEDIRRLQGCFLQEQSDKTKERLEKLKAEIHEKKLRLLALKASTKFMESPEREATKPQDLLTEKYSSAAMSPRLLDGATRSAPAPAMLVCVCTCVFVIVCVLDCICLV